MLHTALSGTSGHLRRSAYALVLHTALRVVGIGQPGSTYMCRCKAARPRGKLVVELYPVRLLPGYPTGGTRICHYPFGYGKDLIPSSRVFGSTRRVLGDIHVPGEISRTIPPKNPLNDLNQNPSGSPTHAPLYIEGMVRVIAPATRKSPGTPVPKPGYVVRVGGLDSVSCEIFHRVSTVRCAGYGEEYRTGDLGHVTHRVQVPGG